LPDPSAVVDPAKTLSDNERTDGEIDDQRLVLIKLAQEVQAVVRNNVTAQSWQVFWHVSVDGWTKKETAKALGMKTLAVHAANKRVAERLAKEGARRLGEMN
jgi:DNA-directed RNA polymerase specialized sigma24 family protein